MKLRYYQEEAVTAIWDYFRDGGTGNPVVAMPTGTGKSIVIAGFVQQVYQMYPNQRLMMLTHVKELIEQNFDKLMTIWPAAPAGIYSAGIKRKDTHAAITFAGIQSVAKKAALFKHIDLLIIDECHLVSPKGTTTYQKFINELKKVNPAIKVIGLTATPYRLGLGKLTDGGIFTDVCYDLTKMARFNRLISEGYLAPLVPKQTAATIDVDGVKVRGGEFVEKDLQAAVDQEAITYEAVKEIIEKGSDRAHWLIFATGVEHSEHIVAMLDSFDIPSAAVHSKLLSGERDQRIADFKDGKIRALVNNNVLTTGFDFPAIDLIGMIRPTNSPGLWVQMLGRGTRPVYAPGFDLSTDEGRLAAMQAGPKQNCLVLDFAGNTKRLGPINDPVLPKPKGKGGGVAPVRTCEQCGTMTHSSVRICPTCGFEFPRTVKFGATAGNDKLIADSEFQIEIFKVDRVVYAYHHKEGRPDAIKVSYYCGLRFFHEYICLEHEGYAGKRAREWWRNHWPHEVAVPATTDEAMAQIDSVPVPFNIRVWINKKYPEVMAHDFTGTSFATGTPAPNA